MEREAQNVQDYARVNAKWTDQTGNARQGLFARHSTGGGRNAKGQFTGGGKSTHNITLYHTMPYGIWLEVRWAGKYAIIVPTIQVEGARIMGNVNKLMAMMA